MLFKGFSVDTMEISTGGVVGRFLFFVFFLIPVEMTSSAADKEVRLADPDR